MIETPEVIQTESRPTAFIHLTIPREEIQHVMGPGLQEVRAAVAAQGVAAEGPWFTHHLSFDPDRFDFEIHVPVSAPLVTVGRVTAGEWPSMKVARTVYVGRYDWLPKAWIEFNGWLHDQGLEPAGDLWEVYVSGPDKRSNPAEWRTELYRPLVD